MKKVTTKQAAEILGIPILSLQWGIRNGNIPIGTYLIRPGKKRGSYHIVPEKLNQYAGKKVV
ncbi:hypothetical protein [uncultured Eubacterium sp.]|uniref:hypothetical protein n=1 Tax=uncultured Eubacterium sp. TaxID=165185 RepID=UPI002671F7C3|nr:hypothetical protein [uncultured Eubacterium sp.]